MNNLLKFKAPKTLELLKVAIEQIQDWLVITDVDGKILYINKQVERISGYKENEIIGQKPSIWKSGESPQETYTVLWDTILSGRPFYKVIANRHKNGGIFYLANTISPVSDKNGEIQYFVSTAKDITQNYELEKQLHDVIHYDSLTQLPNRRSFISEIQEIVCGTKKSAILAISMNKLSLVNNTYGFTYGDRVIKKIAKRIESVLDETHVLARIENHVFAILVPEFKSLSGLVSLINKIEKVVGDPIILKGQELYIELSTGVGVYPSDATGGIKLLARAQTALAQVQSTHNLHKYVFYTQQMNTEAQMQLHLENDIYRAYENNEFIPYFQPVMNIKDGNICGLEALMRRENSLGEIILPTEFIGMLERMGLIEKVELRFIKKVCDQIRKWIDSGLKVVPVAINISPLQFGDKNLAKKIVKIVNEVGIPSELITIEIVESMFMEDLELAKSILKELKDEGFLIAIDDFGTGYSSLSYLKEFNADHLKIDMSFIKELLISKGDQAIVKAIVAIAQALEMKTVAEGIETIEQLELIAKLGCDIGQGHYWDIPLSAEEIASKYLQKAR